MNAIELLKKHQWAGTAYGGYGSQARRCPECLGLHPDDRLNNGGGEYTIGNGHLAGCAIEQCLISADTDNEAFFERVWNDMRPVHGKTVEQLIAEGKIILAANKHKPKE